MNPISEFLSHNAKQFHMNQTSQITVEFGPTCSISVVQPLNLPSIHFPFENHQIIVLYAVAVLGVPFENLCTHNLLSHPHTEFHKFLHCKSVKLWVSGAALRFSEWINCPFSLTSFSLLNCLLSQFMFFWFHHQHCAVESIKSHYSTQLAVLLCLLMLLFVCCLREPSRNPCRKYRCIIIAHEFRMNIPRLDIREEIHLELNWQVEWQG